MGRKFKKVREDELCEMKKGEGEIVKKYEERLAEHTDAGLEDVSKFSSEYEKFRAEALSERLSWYESWCGLAENLLRFKPNQKDLPELERAVATAHLQVTPAGAASFAALVAFLFILLGLAWMAVGVVLSTDFFADLSKVELPVFFPLLFLVLAFVCVRVLSHMPLFLAARWRLRASNQMVLCMLYIVIFMRHTSNLENAIKFAMEHVGPPLSLDLRKIFWDIETGTFSTIKESLDHYLESWRHYNLEFVTSFHLVEASLYEPTESRRVELLEKALEVMLEGTYEKMLHYAQELKNPVTTLHMLGIILPILGLVVFPLVGSFLQGLVQWYHLAFLYNVLLPVVVLVFGMNMLAKRPTGYGESRFAEKVYKTAFDPFWLCAFLGSLLMIVGFFPIIINLLNPSATVGDKCGNGDLDLGLFGCFLDYQEKGGKLYGPFGLGALVVSFFVPFGLALAFGLYYRLRTAKLVKIRNETLALEKEYAAALFQLGNRIGDGVPAELAFNKVALTLEGTPAGDFFGRVDQNVRMLGMSVEEAIFNEKNGAILASPSPLIESSMEVLVEAARKGPKIVSQSLITISNYVDKINRVNERLKDLMAEVVSSMKSQIGLMTPAIAGIVVGISSMIVAIIVNLNVKFSQLSLGAGVEGVGDLGALVDIFGVEGIIPGFFFQLVVGVYVVQLTYILTKLQSGIENGEDPVMERYLLGRNMYRGVFLYVILSLIVSVLFFLLANKLLEQSF